MRSVCWSASNCANRPVARGEKTQSHSSSSLAVEPVLRFDRLARDALPGIELRFADRKILPECIHWSTGPVEGVHRRIGETVTQLRPLLPIMATTVKVDEDAKSRLEELQAEIRLRTGRNVTQQELLTRIIDGAYESRDEVVDSFRESTVPLSEDEKETMRRGRFRSGVETDEGDIDDALYG